MRHGSAMSENPVGTQFVGKKSRVFWLALKTGVLTVLTLGFYRFWMKTRLRRWYWSAVRPGGYPLEYVGDPFEKLLGFLIAVVILAFYIGIVNLLLMFLSYSFFQDNFVAYAASFVGVIPLWFYAQFRSRRYVLARTRWMGLRFGLEPGAWGYAGRALLYWALTIVSLGSLAPLMVFRLEKYITDRTYFGTERMHQGGRWTMLYRPMRPLIISVLMLVVAGVLIMVEHIGPGTGLSILGAGGVLYGYFAFKVNGLAVLTRHKHLAGCRLDLSPSAGTVLGIHALGYVLALFVIAVPGTVLFIVMLVVQSPETAAELSLGSGGWVADQSRWGLVAISAMLYFSIFLLWSALTHTFVTMPTIKHYARRLTLIDPAGLLTVTQRPRDEADQAEGFAEALDVGASI